MRWNLLAIWVAVALVAAPAVAAPLVADANADGKVNVLDLIAIRNSMGKDAAGAASAADVNGDGRVNVLDLISARNSLGAENLSDEFPAFVADLEDPCTESASLPQPVSLAADYFPLQVGNWWEYEVRRPGTPPWNRYRVEVTGKAYSYHYFTFYWITKYFPGIAPEKRLVCRTYGNTVFEWPRNAKCMNLWYKLGAAPGSTWRFALEGGEPCYSPLSATIKDRSQKVSVPAGDFANCIEIVYGHECSDAGPEAEWFAPGAGLVKRVETTIAGPVETVLTKACVDGEIIPGLRLLDGFGVLVKSDAPSFTNNLMPPGIILPTMTATLVVFNYGNEPVTFNFNTSQRFDFVITDNAHGVEWYRWSNGRAFMEVLGSETLLNDRLVYTVKIYLENPFWLGPGPGPLPDGLYTLEAILTSRDRPMSGKTTFEIRSVH